MTTHAKLSASGSHRWITCPGSVRACDYAPKQAPSIAADLGTAAHELAEITLAAGKYDCREWLNHPVPGNNAITVDKEMVTAVNEYLHLIETIGGVQLYEHRVDFSEWVPGGFGTSDCIAYKDGTLYVIDLKYGVGVRVDAEENTQGLLYALGAYSEMEFAYPIERVCIIICQPRLERVSEWEISTAELLKRGAWIAERAQLAVSDNAPRVPEENACRWCPAAPTCAALLTKTHAVTAKDFDDLPQADTLTDDQVAEALKAKRLIVGWLDAVEAYATERANRPEGFPGFKLVEGRSSRAWVDDTQAEAALTPLLGDAAHERKLLSVAKAEKLLDKAQRKEIATLVIKRPGAPTLVPDSDPRKPAGATAEDFEDF